MSAILHCTRVFLLACGLSGSPGKDDERVEVGMQKVAGQPK